jgi:hypothetical protein
VVQGRVEGDAVAAVVDVGQAARQLAYARRSMNDGLGRAAPCRDGLAIDRAAAKEEAIAVRSDYWGR